MFILDGERDADVVGAFQRYAEYVDAHREAFPPGALLLATADWYFAPIDSRCPHDSWLESACIVEPSSGERREIRTIDLRVRLLGSYHDGYLELTYTDVSAYQMLGPEVGDGHHDWRYDEFRLSTDGRLLHEIEWSGGSRWIIECRDIGHEWIPSETE